MVRKEELFVDFGKIEAYARKSISENLKILSTTKEGLSSEEAIHRKKEYVKKFGEEKVHAHILLAFFKELKSPFLLVLLFAAGISFFVGETTDSIIILAIVCISAILDFSQKYSADSALKKLLDRLKITTIVIRNNEKKEIPIQDVVVGDILFLSSGDMVPADARIIENHSCFVNEATMTGETFPVQKTADFILKKEGINEKNEKNNTHFENILLAGTSIISGYVYAVTIKTGKNTEYGTIASTLNDTDSKSEFLQGIDNFGLFIMKLGFFLVIFIFLFNSLFKHAYFESFMFAIAISVGLTPELLPLIRTITLTIGSKKMEKKGVLVKKLSAIPNFGSMSVLCTDKTGTLTENKIALANVVNYSGEVSLNLFRFAYINSFFQAGVKNPIDDALLQSRNHHSFESISAVRKIDEIPYDFSRKMITVIVEDVKKIATLITKGAPENVFTICTKCMVEKKEVKMTNAILKKAQKTYDDLSKQGYRVLAVAIKNEFLKNKNKERKFTRLDEKDMTFLGFILFSDTIKKDVKAVIQELEELGVEIKVLTGDNEFVTEKVCRDAGLLVKGVLLGNEIAQLSQNALAIRLKEVTICARCSPIEKQKIILALRSRNIVVGYLGDGINDAPSLTCADVGISVDTGVDVAKEAANIIITKKSLYDLKEGIIDGRKAFNNMMKYIMMSISSNFGNMFSAAGAVLFLPFLPMLPTQILLNNLIYDVSQFAIPTDHVDREELLKPKHWNFEFIKKFMYVFGPISSLFDFLLFGILFFVLHVSIGVFQTAWFIESLATQLLVIHIIRTRKIPFVKSKPTFFLLASSLFFLCMAILIPYTSFGSYFKFVQLPLPILLLIAGIVCVYLFCVQIVKTWFFKKWMY